MKPLPPVAWVAGLPDALNGAGASLAALLLALGTSIAAIATALRTRKDVDVVELHSRIEKLEARVAKLEGEAETNREELEDAREELVAAEASTFRLRRVLAQNGLADPTLETT